MKPIHTNSPALDRAPPEHLLERASLFLDFDGTLVELAHRPDAVRVSLDLQNLLGRYADRLGGRMAIISGRPAAEIRSLLKAEGVTVVGCHGLEFHHFDGAKDIASRPAALAQILDSAEKLRFFWPRLLIEDKPLGVALHFRLCPSAEPDCRAFAAEHAERHDLHFQTGKMMVEVRAPGGDKGTAIRKLMENPQMRGTAPVFLGDDDTDEAGFVVVEELGGAGILVGQERRTSARYRLESPTAVLEWLSRACP